jgi:thiosulfate/3-mercaptopyruvate sulfurtransferase
MSEPARLLIDPRELHAQLGDPALRVLDATVVLRSPPEGGPYEVLSGRPGYEAGHIPGAAFADLAGALSAPAPPRAFALPAPRRFAAAAGRIGVGEGTRVVVYAQTSPMWATRLWWLLRYFGFDAVRVLDGGLPAWRAAGLPLSRAPASYPPAAFASRPRPHLLATRADVEATVAGTAPGCLLSALVPETFRGERPTSYSRPGRIPGSVNAPWERLIDPATNRFHPPARLAAELAVADGAGDVVAYCGAGISATVDVLAFALLGRDDVRLYDGSLVEWSADPALPLETGPPPPGQ